MGTSSKITGIRLKAGTLLRPGDPSKGSIGFRWNLEYVSSRVGNFTTLAGVHWKRNLYMAAIIRHKVRFPRSLERKP
jgi:hypothetical protein